MEFKHAREARNASSFTAAERGDLWADPNLFSSSLAVSAAVRLLLLYYYCCTVVVLLREWGGVCCAAASFYE